MNLTSSILSRALQLHERLLGGPTFIYRGGRYKCKSNTANVGDVVELGGNTYEVIYSILVRKDEVPVAITADSTDVSADWEAKDVLTADADQPSAFEPFAGRRIGKDMKLYRIVRVRDNPSGSHWTIDLADARR